MDYQTVQIMFVFVSGLLIASYGMYLLQQRNIERTQQLQKSYDNVAAKLLEMEEQELNARLLIEEINSISRSVKTCNESLKNVDLRAFSLAKLFDVESSINSVYGQLNALKVSYEKGMTGARTGSAPAPTTGQKAQQIATSTTNKGSNPVANAARATLASLAGSAKNNGVTPKILVEGMSPGKLLDKAAKEVGVSFSTFLNIASELDRRVTHQNEFALLNASDRVIITRQIKTINDAAKKLSQVLNVEVTASEFLINLKALDASMTARKFADSKPDEQLLIVGELRVMLEEEAQKRIPQSA